MKITVSTAEAQKSFYPTPPDLAAKLLDGIELNYTNSILEPSAGTGNLIFAMAEHVRKVYYHGRFGGGRCDMNVDCCEIDAGLRGILTDSFSSSAAALARDKFDEYRRTEGIGCYETPEYDQLEQRHCLLSNTNLRVVHDDFLSYQTYKPYDLIIMNPPFADGDAHLLKAISMQERTGGKIRCILNAQTIRNPYNRRRQQLIKKLSQYNAEISYEEDAFTNADRSASVDVAIIKLDIPAPKMESDIFKNCLKAEMEQLAQTEESHEVVLDDEVKKIVAYYRAEIAAGVQLINEYTALKPHIMSSVKKESYDHPLIRVSVGNSDHATDEPSINEFCQSVRLKYWRALFMNPEFLQQLTSSLRDELSNRVHEMKDLEFSEFNIKTLYAELNARMAEGVEENIMALFEKLTVSHSYHKDIKNGNVHFFNGWCTNQAYKIGKKVVLPFYSDVFGSHWCPRDNISAFDACSELSDIEKALNYLDGNMTAEVDLYNTLQCAERSGQTRKIECKYFKATFYKKRTVHLEFTCPELIDRFNLFCARKKGWLPPSYGKSAYQDMTEEEQAVVDSYHGDDTPGSGENAYAQVLERASYYLAPPNQNTLALPDAI